MMADASPRTETSTDDTDDNHGVSLVDLDLGIRCKHLLSGLK
jgi:hypothetical protein